MIYVNLTVPLLVVLSNIRVEDPFAKERTQYRSGITYTNESPVFPVRFSFDDGVTTIVHTYAIMSKSITRRNLVRDWSSQKRLLN